MRIYVKLCRYVPVTNKTNAINALLLLKVFKYLALAPQITFYSAPCRSPAGARPLLLLFSIVILGFAMAYMALACGTAIDPSRHRSSRLPARPRSSITTSWSATDARARDWIVRCGHPHLNEHLPPSSRRVRRRSRAKAGGSLTGIFHRFLQEGLAKQFDSMMDDSTK